MCQAEPVGELDQVVGYVLKQAATALRNAMEVALRPLALSVPQYACLELLGQQPGLSSSALARGAFVTRQSMNQVLRGLQDRGLVTRPATASYGRALPTRLTPAGRKLLRVAGTAVRAIEQQMISHLEPSARHRLRGDLASCVAALTPTGPMTADEPAAGPGRQGRGA